MNNFRIGTYSRASQLPWVANDLQGFFCVCFVGMQLQAITSCWRKLMGEENLNRIEWKSASFPMGEITKPKSFKCLAAKDVFQQRGKKHLKRDKIRTERMAWTSHADRSWLEKQIRALLLISSHGLQIDLLKPCHHSHSSHWTPGAEGGFGLQPTRRPETVCGGDL